MVQNWLTVTDFDSMLDNFAGRQATLEVVTRVISNQGGKELNTYASGTTIKCYFVRTDQKYDYEKAGLVEVGNGIMLAKYADGVKKDDKITVDGSKFIVKEALNVPGVFDSTGSGTTMVYTACSLFLDT